MREVVLSMLIQQGRNCIRTTSERTELISTGEYCCIGGTDAVVDSTARHLSTCLAMFFLLLNCPQLLHFSIRIPATHELTFNIHSQQDNADGNAALVGVRVLER